MAHDLPNHHFPGDCQVCLAAAAVIDPLQGDLSAPPPRTVNAALHKGRPMLNFRSRALNGLPWLH